MCAAPTRAAPQGSCVVITHNVQLQNRQTRSLWRVVSNARRELLELAGWLRQLQRVGPAPARERIAAQVAHVYPDNQALLTANTVTPVQRALYDLFHLERWIAPLLGTTDRSSGKADEYWASGCFGEDNL